MSGFVYFIKPVGQDGPIKIGHSTFPPARLASLQTWSPVELELVAHFPAPRQVETDLHDRFARWQLRGEWFEASRELTDLIAGIRDGGRLRDLVDLSATTGKLQRRPNTKSPLAMVVGSYKLRVERARQKGGALRGRQLVLPTSVRTILSSAGGYRQAYRALTAAEIDTLEAYIADCRRAPAAESAA
jgi:hypothetical protein